MTGMDGQGLSIQSLRDVLRSTRIQCIVSKPMGAQRDLFRLNKSQSKSLESRKGAGTHGGLDRKEGGKGDIGERVCIMCPYEILIQQSK